MAWWSSGPLAPASSCKYNPGWRMTHGGQHGGLELLDLRQCTLLQPHRLSGPWWAAPDRASIAVEGERRAQVTQATVLPSSEEASSSTFSSQSARRTRRDQHKKKVDHSRNVKIPAFDGQQKGYKEYRRAVKRCQAGGKRWYWFSLTKHLSARRLREKQGVRLLLDAPDEEYLGLQEDKLDEVAEEFVACRRQNHETMSKYIRRLKEARRELEDEDDQMLVSDKFFSWPLLRRAASHTSCTLQGLEMSSACWSWYGTQWGWPSHCHWTDRSVWSNRWAFTGPCDLGTTMQTIFPTSE